MSVTGRELLKTGDDSRGDPEGTISTQSDYRNGGATGWGGEGGDRVGEHAQM